MTTATMAKSSPATKPPANNADLAALAVALLLPSAVTWLYFVELAGSGAPLARIAYGVGKAAQFLLPAVWVLLIRRQWPRWTRPSSASVLLGLLFGVAVFGAALAGYWFWLKPAGLLASAAGEAAQKMRALAVTGPASYLAMAVFYAAVHSLLEEYYWRWFVLGQLRRWLPTGAAIAVSSVGFTAHHVIVLAVYFGSLAPATWLFSLCVAIGGGVWGWLYLRSGSLVGPWLSHLLVDAAIFWIGYDLVRGTMGW
jgi:uncharacterized protein